MKSGHVNGEEVCRLGILYFFFLRESKKQSDECAIGMRSASRFFHSKGITGNKSQKAAARRHIILKEKRMIILFQNIRLPSQVR